MLEIKDLAGISEPLKKLIEVVAQGVGGISSSILTRKNAEAKPTKLEQLLAIAEAKTSWASRAKVVLLI
jgi:hypothetical protein